MVLPLNVPYWKMPLRLVLGSKFGFFVPGKEASIIPRYHIVARGNNGRQRRVLRNESRSAARAARQHEEAPSRRAHGSALESSTPLFVCNRTKRDRLRKPERAVSELYSCFLAELAERCLDTEATDSSRDSSARLWTPWAALNS